MDTSEQPNAFTFCHLSAVPGDIHAGDLETVGNFGLGFLTQVCTLKEENETDNLVFQNEEMKRFSSMHELGFINSLIQAQKSFQCNGVFFSLFSSNKTSSTKKFSNNSETWSGIFCKFNFVEFNYEKIDYYLLNWNNTINVKTQVNQSRKEQNKTINKNAFQ